ncbi:MAG: 2,3-bisphosphoglycerate-independent phosphoglycerate mutase [Pyrinomonadaceae bacterium]|nr:2,3-bisphosphoglycerate-independent phosphoglycerate mutase [Pyrinomonadaceae bacterium]MBP9108141.1 2,3-bisphosphoglycerate-independent phosphoglycerate mutase [Pyrinomonadaceae bacterium]
MDIQNDKLSRPVALVILDGWGYAPRTEGNAIAMAHTPYYDEICRRYPMTTLAAAGEAVGQNPDDPGSVEVGHLNIGTGRVAQTEVSRIKNAVLSGEFLDNAVLKRAFAKAKENGGAVHLIGLMSDGGVHSSSENLFALVRMAKKHGLERVFIHCILDGVDVPPRTADVYVEALEIKLADIGLGKIATLCGRFFAMDANERWERTARAFTMLVHAEGERAIDAVSAIRNSFLRGISDEFIAPIVIEAEPDTPAATVKSGDLVVFFNHRGDGIRQLVRSLCLPEGESGAKPEVETVCLTEYDRAFNLPAAFRQEPEKNTLTDVLSKLEIRNLKVTETARFSHLTVGFDGGADEPQQFEEQVLMPATSATTPDHTPESQSFKIANRVMRGMESSTGGVFIANIPAAALMAETGDVERTRAAIQYIDTCIGGICEKAEERGGIVILTSSHGNCEEMLHTESGEPSYASTANPVPFHLIDTRNGRVQLRDDGSLSDIAPTILGILGIEKPSEMTGEDLRVL